MMARIITNESNRIKKIEKATIKVNNYSNQSTYIITQ